jgi:hypothetical protein
MSVIQSFILGIEYWTSSCPEMVNLARGQGGQWIQTEGILSIFRGFEFIAQCRAGQRRVGQRA